jgi:hypothetical protein
MPDQIVQNTHFYSPVTASLARYRYSQLNPDASNSNTIALQPTASSELRIRIPSSSVCNLARSYFTIQYTIPAGGAGQYACAFENGCELARSIDYSDTSGLAICALAYADVYKNTMQPLSTSYETFITRDQLLGMYPCNQSATNNVLPYSRDNISTGDANASTTNYTETQYLQIAPTPNSALNISRVLYLGDYSETFFAVDKDHASIVDMLIRIQTNYTSRMFFYTTYPANILTTNTSQSTSTTITLQNVYFYLAVQENMALREGIINKVLNGGLSYTIPAPYIYRESSVAYAGSFSKSYTLTRMLGKLIKSITYVPYSALEFTCHAYDHSVTNPSVSSNISGGNATGRISSFQTQLDSRPTTDRYLTIYNPQSSIGGATYTSNNTWGSDYLEARRYLVGSVISNYSIYQTQWSYRDSWGQLSFMDKIPNSGPIPQENIIDGLDVSQGDRTWSINVNLVAPSSTATSADTSGLLHYFIIHFLRTVTFNSQGVVLSS